MKFKLLAGSDPGAFSVARKRFQLLSEGDKKVLELMERVQNKISQG